MTVVVTAALLVFGSRGDRRLVLAAHIAALDPEHARAVDADEGAGTGNLGGIVEHGPLVERLERRFDLAQPLVDFLGKLLGVRILFLETLELGLERIARRRLLLAGRNLGAAEPSQAIGVPVREVGCDLDPLPALRAHRFGLPLQLLGDETVEQPRILQPSPVVRLEEIAQDDAAPSPS